MRLLAYFCMSLSLISITTLGQNLIQKENQKPGTQEWLLKNPNIPQQHNKFVQYNSGIRSPAIEGYFSKPYTKAGDTLTFFVSTKPVSNFTISLYRMGYYDGNGARHISDLGIFEGKEQPLPVINERRLMECKWTPSGQLIIPSDWLSGVYLAKLTTIKDGYDSYMIFILADSRKADINFQCSDISWQCYNVWPEIHSIYNNGKVDNYRGKEIDVSWDRPYGKYYQLLNQSLSLGSGEFLLWEFPFVFWAEKQGYDITYTSNWNTHDEGLSGLTRTKAFLSVGHDEYWTEEMYDHVTAARDAGVHLGFFNGNSIGRSVALGPNSSGVKNRTMHRKGNFRGGRFQGENNLMGAQSAGGTIGSADWRCMAPDHWIFEGTNMQFGEGIPGLVGWEYHSKPANKPDLVRLAYGYTNPYRISSEATIHGDRGHYTATYYEANDGNTMVFNSATIWWADGLSEPPGYMRSQEYLKRNGPDARVQRITKNILDKMVN